MSKTSFKKHKRDFYNEEEEFHPKIKNAVDKRKEKRVDRALKTKDIDYLLHSDDDGLDPLDDEYNQEYYK